MQVSHIVDKDQINAVCQLAIRRLKEAASIAANTAVHEHVDACCKGLSAVIADDAAAITQCLQAEEVELKVIAEEQERLAKLK